MLEIFQEAQIPKLSETSLFQKFNETSHLADAIKSEIMNSAGTTIKPESIKEILSLIRLNGDAIAKKAVDAYMAGKIIIIHNAATSKIPPTLPYIVMNMKNETKVVIFADKFMNKIDSAAEYTNLMAVMEAAYLALKAKEDPSTFLMNSQLLLTLCNVYTLMAISPLEQRLYMKGENLNKAMMYVITYFYATLNGNTLTVDRIPFKRLMNDKIDTSIANSILDDVLGSEDKSFMGLIKMIQKINPIRYKDLDAMYMSYFIQVCGTSIIFALENIPYLFLLITSSSYKTQVTTYSLNKTVGMPAKKAITLLTTTVAQ